MPSPNTIQDRRHDHVGGRQSGGQYRGGDNEGDDAQPLGVEIRQRQVANAPTCWFRGCRRYSVPARPACVTTLPQRAISEPIKRSSSSGEEMPLGIMPRLMICC